MCSEFRGARCGLRVHEVRGPGSEVRVPSSEFRGAVPRCQNVAGRNRPCLVSQKISENSVKNRPCLSNEVASLDDLAVRALIF